MCGFVGSFTKDSGQNLPKSLGGALQTLKHRGPDSSGEFKLQTNCGYLQLGFRRLAIIDLSDAANQPFISNDLRFIMVFNGEIYNYIELRNHLKSIGYRFKTTSDTEVVMASWEEWGINSVEKFIGMFSIAIFDKLKSELWCIRDSYGIKPFFYSCTKDAFYFASEIKALLCLSRTLPEMNENVALNYIIQGEYDQSAETFYDNIYQLEPGHFIKVEFKDDVFTPEPKRWWFPKVTEDRTLSFEDAAELLREEFLKSVNLHLRSDVKVAAALSGGIDSSAIVSAIRHVAPELEINTFSYIAEDSQINEQPWIDLVNSKTMAIPHLVTISSQDFDLQLDDLISAQGEPFGSTSLFAQYKIYESAKEAGITVMLDGQGADELLAGYYGYPESRLQSLLEKNSAFSALSQMSAWSRLPGRELKHLVRPSLSLLIPKKFDQQISRILQNNRTPEFLKNGHFDSKPFPEVYPSYEWKGRRLSQRLLKEQTSGELLSLLRHVDRNSMRWSIESRVPFLNSKLSELVLSFPEEYLLNGVGETKSVFREAMRGIVDDKILDRKDKIGFATPQKKWITMDFIEQNTILDGSKSIDFFNQGSLEKFLKSDINSSIRSMNLAWRVVNLVKWRRIHGFEK
jgi:asparagine synthase (glutamine-hydrolysing)